MICFRTARQSNFLPLDSFERRYGDVGDPKGTWIDCETIKVLLEEQEFLVSTLTSEHQCGDFGSY
jgi:hypothetical protein